MTDLAALLVPLHLGALHPHERLLVLLVAFGPFLVLPVVVYVARRRAIAEEDAERHAAAVRPASDPPARPGPPGSRPSGPT